MTTDPKLFHPEQIEEIDNLFRLIAPEAKTPKGPWFRQVESYTQVLLGSTRRRLRHITQNPSLRGSICTIEIEPIMRELELLDKCTAILLEFAKEKG